MRELGCVYFGSHVGFGRCMGAVLLLAINE